MKILYLLRHAKAVWMTGSLDDFDRPLNERGRKEALYLGEYLSTRDVSPQQIVASSALRAVRTSEIIAEKINYPLEEILKEKNLYEATALDIRNVILQTDNNIGSLMIVGHNPGMTDLINMLSNKRLDNLPTTGIVCLTNDKNNWNDFNSDWELKFFEYPK